MKTLPISLPTGRLADFCRANHVRRLSLFGSVVRDDYRPDSDIDMLIEFHPDHGVGYLGLAALEMELSQMLGGKVDLNTPGSLSEYFVDDVLREAVVIHDAS